MEQHHPRRWKILPSRPDLEDHLSRNLRISRVLARILVNRGLEDIASANAFLSPSLKHLLPPRELPDMDAAAERIHRAIQSKEPIVVHGDYDVDGLTSTALLTRCLQLAGATVDMFIPDRLTEGYGLSNDAIRRLAEKGAKLIVTVDCGVTAIEPIALAKSLGVDVVVCDHHEPGDALPDACAVVNPKSPRSQYGFRDLAGAGVAFKLAWAVAEKVCGGRVTPAFRERLLESVALAAIGTLADIVPLHGENRVLAKFGLELLAGTKSPGLRALMNVSRVKPPLRAWDIGFCLGPRMNAAGRLGDALIALELLMTESASRAAEIAETLDKHNTQRREIEKAIAEEAEERVRRELNPEEEGVLILGDENWHPGVIGIVASRLVEKFYRPVFLIAFEGESGRGSGRSIPGVHLFELLTRCSDALISFGGHEMAAGLHIERGKLDAFREQARKVVREIAPPEVYSREIRIDAEVELTEINAALLSDIGRLEPFGVGNPRPLFVCRNVRPGAPRPMGGGDKHFSFFAVNGQTSIRAVAFNRFELFPIVENSETIDIAFSPRVNEYRGSRSIELDVKDLRPAAC